MAKEKKYPEITPDLPYQRTWTLFYIIIWIIGPIISFAIPSSLLKIL